MMLKRFSDAIPHYHSALERELKLFTKDEILRYLADAYRETGDLEKAIETQRQCISEQENPIFTDYAEMGEMLEEAGRDDEAIAMYTVAVGLCSDAIPAYDRLFGLLMKKGSEELVKSMCTALAMESPDDPAVRKLHAKYAGGEAPPPKLLH
jgi:tetratricopeptide (TPR) repeat protein